MPYNSIAYTTSGIEVTYAFYSLDEMISSHGVLKEYDWDSSYRL